MGIVWLNLSESHQTLNSLCQEFQGIGQGGGRTFVPLHRECKRDWITEEDIHSHSVDNWEVGLDQDGQKIKMMDHTYGELMSLFARVQKKKSKLHFESYKSFAVLNT